MLDKDHSIWNTFKTAGVPFKLQAGQVMFYSGHQPYGIYILLSGSVRFMDGKTCREHLTPTPLGPALALNNTIENQPHCCSCQAETTCEALFLPKTIALRML